jgi:endonuclease/exonuclease/phosphatase family metal-dependent hydrolase
VTLRLLTYNIQRGGRGRQAALARVIVACAPDVAILQEATRPEVVEALAEATGMPHFGSRSKESLGFLSRRPIAAFAWHRPRVSRHAFLELAVAGTPLRVFGVHLSAVHAAWTERRRAFELRALLKSIARHQTGFHVLIGDFNTLAPGEILDLEDLPRRLRTLVWMSGGRIRFRTIQLVLDAGYADAFRTLHPGKPGLTFPARHPHVRLDYAFVPAGHVERVRSCEVVTVSECLEASDHFPVLVEIEAKELSADQSLEHPEVPGSKHGKDGEEERNHAGEGHQEHAEIGP